MSAPITKTGPRAEQLRRASRRHYWNRQPMFQERGLTTRGTRPVYQRHKIAAHGKLRKKLRARIYGRRLNRAGLSWRGNPLGRGFRVTRQDRAWRALRATIQVPELLNWDLPNHAGEMAGGFRAHG